MSETQLPPHDPLPGASIPIKDNKPLLSDCSFQTDIPAFSLASYLRDHAFVLVIALFCDILVGIMLKTLGVSSAGIIAIIGVITGCFLTAFILNYVRKVAFYRNLQTTLESLCAATYFTSLITEPSFLEGRIAYESAAIVSKKANAEQESMVEQTDAYRNYIEAWIHEIKTPLAAIKLMLSHTHDAQSSKIAREIERIELQVDQALYYARSAAASKDYAIREVNLAHICQETCKRNARLLIERGISLNFNLDPDLMVLTDEAWIAFILSQFVVNAAKYDATTLTFIARVEDANTPFGRTILEVIDNGCGIPAADMPRVFERGYIGSVGRKHGSATGMGLYLVARLCDSLGLNVMLASEEGSGTRAILAFPHDRKRLAYLTNS